MPKQIPPLPVPRNRPRLEPFYSVFVEVVVPFALGAQLFSATRRLSRRQRKRLVDDIESASSTGPGSVLIRLSMSAPSRSACTSSIGPARDSAFLTQRCTYRRWTKSTAC